MLDRAQQQAIRHVYGPCLAIAGPGAGKTHVLIRRIAHLTQDIGIPPDQLLVITFTKAAALEMKKRYLQAVPPSFSGVHFGTFHSIFFSILKEKAFFSGQNLLDSQTKRYIMKTACEKAGVDPTRIPDFFSQIDRDISFLKNTDSALSQFEPAGVSREEFRVLFETYETMRRDLRKLDFDDMQSQVRELFVKEPEALAYYQKRFRFFLVDEAQDMNRLQYDILRMFLTPPYNLFLVGDDDQAIYSFRGARPELFLGFQKDFPQAKIVSLANNYRCDKDIVKAGLSLISANAVRFPKNLVSISQLEGKIRFLPFQNERDEASGLVRLIKLEKQRQPDKSVAILYRNHVRSQLLLAELERGGLLGEGKRTHKDWFDEPCVRLVEDYLSAAAYPPKREVILRICNKPQRFLPRKGLEEEVVDFEKWAFCQTDHHAAARIRLLRQELFQIAKLPSVAAISYILYKIGCAAFAKEAGMYNDAALGRLMEAAKEFSRPQKLLAELRLQRSKETEPEKNSKEESHTVHCYTFHGAKGLEFDHVYIVDANEGITPSRLARTTVQIEEERRMFYVAMTRAKHELSIATIMRLGNEELYPSRFLKELGEGFS